MIRDTEWPATTPKIEADRIASCIRYLSAEARKAGFRITAEVLEAANSVVEDEVKNLERP